MKKLNFGCGSDIKDEKEGWDNVDIQKHPKITKSFDFNKFPYPLKDDYYDYVYICTVLENLDEPEKALLELHKKCKKDALIEIIAPYWNNKGVWNDLKSKRGFNKECFYLLAEKSPNYYINSKKNFEIYEIKLVPTIIGKFMPKKLRESLSSLVSGLIMHVQVKLRVIKK